MKTVEGRPRGARKKKIYEQIAERLRELIAAGQMGPGDRLPPERKLAEIFKVSRNSVREAIKALEEQRVVVSRTGAGTYVAESEAGRVVDAMAGAFGEGRRRLAEVFELRRILEPQIAMLAAQRISAEGVAELTAIVNRQKEIFEGGGSLAELDDRFHLLIVSAAANNILMTVCETIRDLVGESRSESLQSQGRSQSAIESHMAIVDALKRGDGELAAERMHRHLLHVEESVAIP